MDFSQMSLFELIEFLQKNNLDQYNIKKYIESFYEAFCKNYNYEMCPLIFTDKQKTKGDYTVATYYDYESGIIVILKKFLDAVVDGLVSKVSLLTTIVHEQQHHNQNINCALEDKKDLSEAQKFVSLSNTLIDKTRKLSHYEFCENYLIRGIEKQIYQDFETEMIKEKKWHAGYGALPIEVDARNSALQFLEMLSKKYPKDKEIKRVFKIEQERSVKIFNDAQFYISKEVGFAEEMIKLETYDDFLLRKRESFKQAKKEFLDFLDEQKTGIEECENLSKKFFPLATKKNIIKSVNDN